MNESLEIEKMIIEARKTEIDHLFVMEMIHENDALKRKGELDQVLRELGGTALEGMDG